MTSRYRWFIRTGLLAIGDMFIPQEGAMFQAEENPSAFADLVTIDNYKLWGGTYFWMAIYNLPNPNQQNLD